MDSVHGRADRGIDVASTRDFYAFSECSMRVWRDSTSVRLLESALVDVGIDVKYARATAEEEEEEEEVDDEADEDEAEDEEIDVAAPDDDII